MKCVLLILFGVNFLFNIQKTLAQKKKGLLFHIIINETTPYINNAYAFRGQNIIINKSGRQNWDTIRSFSKKLTETEMLRLYTLIQKLNFSENKRDSVPKNFNNHNPEFKFIVRINQNIYTQEIWGYKVCAYFKLVSLLNAFIPDKFKIAYTNEYFEGKLPFGY